MLQKKRRRRKRQIADRYTLSYDVVLVTESWLDASITSGLLDPDDKFYILRNDRNRKGGGVCVFVNK